MKFRALPLVVLLCLLSTNVYAQHSVDFGQDNDTGKFGFEDLGSWFVANGVSANQAAGEAFAKTGYIGFNAADSDPFFWNSGEYKFSILQSVSGNADLTKLGFYTGVGAAKALTEVFGAGETGSKTVNTAQPFGIYLDTPKSWRSTHYVNWFTDRSENQPSQSGASTTNAGGDPQSLIYRLNSSEWLVAFEDLDYTHPGAGLSDRDFNDLYMKVTVTPEPVSSALFLFGAGALGFRRFRRRSTK